MEQAVVFYGIAGCVTHLYVRKYLSYDLGRFKDFIGYLLIL